MDDFNLVICLLHFDEWDQINMIYQQKFKIRKKVFL